MKKEHIILWILIVLCVITFSFIPPIPKARAELTLPDDEEALFARKEKVVVVEKKMEPTYCGHKKTILVAGFVSNPPFAWAEKNATEDDSEPQLVTKGYSIDLFDKIAKKYQWSYKSVGFSSREELLKALNRGEVDFVVSSYLTQDPSIGGTPIYPAYFKNVFIVYSLADNEYEFNSVDDLVGLRGVVRKEENIYNLLLNKRSLMGLDLEQVSTAEKAFTMLLNDDVDYLIGSPYSIEAELRRFKLMNKIVPSPVALMEGSLFVTMSNMSPCKELRPILSKELKEYTQSGNPVDEVRLKIREWGEEFRNDPGLIPDEEDIEE